MRSAFAAIVFSVAVLSSACSGPSYLRSFDLRQSVCDLSYPGVNCVQPGSGGIGSLAGGIGGSGGEDNLNVSTTEIFGLGATNGHAFDLAAFQAQLSASLKRDLEHSGFEVSDSTASSGVSLHYFSAGVIGRLELEARIADERLVVDLSAHEQANDW